MKLIRDKTFVHIDKNGVFDPEEIYRRANIKGKSIQRAIEDLWQMVNQLYQTQTGTNFRCDEYQGDDILQLLLLRDRHLTT